MTTTNQEKPHILHIGFYHVFKKNLDFDRYRISTIVHKHIAEKMDSQTRGEFAGVGVLDVPHNMNLNEYHDAMDQIVSLADEIAAQNGRPQAVVGMFEHVTLPAAKLRERFDLFGTPAAVAEICRDKVQMKKALVGSEIRFPRFLEIHSIDDSVRNFLLSLPGKVVVKPRSQAASEGVQIFSNGREALNYLNSQESLESLQIEEFITGDIAHFDGLVRDGKLLFFSASEYLSTCFDFVQNGTALASVTWDNPQLVGAGKTFTEKVLAQIGLRDSAFHLEVFHHGGGDFTFLEIGNRFGGAGVSGLLNKVFGVDLVQEAINADIGAPAILQNSRTILETGGSAAWLYIPMPTNKKFTVRGLRGLDKLPPTIIWSDVPNPGDVLNESVAPFAASGKFFVRAESFEKVKADCERIISEYSVIPEVIL